MEGKINLAVSGMTCNHCAGTVDGIIKQEGGHDIHVDYLLGEASFELSDKKKLDRILKRLKAAGYQSENPDGDHEQKKSRFSDVELKFLFTLPFSLVLFSHMFLPMSWFINNPWMQLVLCLPVFGIGLWHFGRSTYAGLKSGHISMDLLILIGSSSAFFYSLYGSIAFYGTQRVHDFLFFETTSTIISLVLLGYVIEHRAVKKTTTVLQKLFSSKPEKAKKLVGKGLNQEIEAVLANNLKVGDEVLVNAGDRIPADGKLKYGILQMDESLITGESDSLQKEKGDTILSGSIVIDGNGVILVERAAEKSTINQIIELVKSSRSVKPEIQKLADRISGWFVPVIVGIAILTFGINYLLEAGAQESLLRAIAVLVISCPCAMGLATPTAVSVGLGMAGKMGIVIKRADVFERIVGLKNMVFDKTGTLTSKTSEIELKLENPSDEELVKSLIKSIEQYSNHPLADSLRSTFKDSQLLEIDDVEEIKGSGLKGVYNQSQIKLGSGSFTGFSSDDDLYLTLDDKLLARISTKQSIQPGAKELIKELKRKHVNPIILSGDRAQKTKSVANELGITNFKSELKPEDKLAEISAIQQNGSVGMIGDGINDAPALAKADLGISIGTSNALAAESAQVVIISDKLDRLRYLMLIGNKVVMTIKQNLFWAFAYNLVAIPMAALGYLDPMVAALSMAFSDVVVIGNSLRLRLQLPNHLC